MSARTVANLKPEQRADAIKPFVGRLCRVTYRRGKYGTEAGVAFPERIDGRILGASYNLTNGTSSNELVIERAWGRFDLVGIGLANVGTITPLAGGAALVAASSPKELDA